MKKLKVLILSFAVLLSAVFAGGIFSVSKTPNQAKAVPVPNNFFNYVTLSQYGQTLNMENLKTLNGTTYVVANGSVTIEFKPFDYIYRNFDYNLSNFYARREFVTIEKITNTATGRFEFPARFEFELFGTKLYASVDSTNSPFIISLHRTETARAFMTSAQTELVNVTESVVGGDSVTFEVIKSFTWLEESDASTFSFGTSTNSISVTNHTLAFERPTINFRKGSNPVTTFSTKIGSVSSTDSLLEKEQEFNEVQMKFSSNNYTEVNPLFFNINYNGFEYTFELYSKVYNSKDLLFINYIDKENSGNNASLASVVELDEITQEEVVKKSVEKDVNVFNMLFKNTGRYEISIFDATHVAGLKNSNFYSTSFYIKQQTNLSVTDLDNIYMIAESYTNENIPIEYIVSDSTQNYTVHLTIKNLEEVLSSDLRDNLMVEVRKTIYGASENLPESTYYTANQIQNMINKSTGDLEFNFDEDADYGVIITDTKNNKKLDEYYVTIAKTAKTHYNANGNNHTATTPFRTEIINYTYDINSTMNIFWNFGDGTNEQSSEIGKTYVNHFSISYGMQRAEIRSTKIAGDKDTAPALVLDFYGVGDITVTYTENGQTKTRVFNSERGDNRLTFSDYGTYNVSIVDSMGTTASGTFEFKQDVNPSTIILIVFSAVVVAVIVFFVLRVRGKVKTR